MDKVFQRTGRKLDRAQDPRLDAQKSKIKTRIGKLFESVSDSNWRHGMRRLGDIPEVRLLLSDTNELEQLKGRRND